MEIDILKISLDILAIRHAGVEFAKDSKTLRPFLPQVVPIAMLNPW